MSETFSDHDRARIDRLAEDFLVKTEDDLPAGATNARIDHLAIIGIVSFTDEDGDECEMPAWRFETSRMHVQHGISLSVLDAMRSRIIT